MKELNETGYMSNRGRINVASFLTRDLEIDWRWGAEYFETQLSKKNKETIFMTVELIGIQFLNELNVILNSESC